MARKPEPPEANGDEQPFLSHLVELRDRLLRMSVAVVAVFIVLAPFANDLYTLLAGPLTEDIKLVAIKPISPFLTPLKLTLVLSIYLAIPYLLYQVWAFVAPGLYQTERALILPLLVSSSALFYLGMAFAYFVVLPLVFSFLSGFGPEGMEFTPDISEYLDFVLTVFFAFGIAFEVPIATILLVRTGAVTPATLKAKRPYVIVGAFIIGMFLTPPDIISQSLLALPMWALYELGLLFSTRFMGPRDTGAGAGDAPDAQGDEYYRPLSPEEMDAELDAMQAGDEDAGKKKPGN
jgi:sec-independent protein translocase protein TatC